MSSAVLHAGHIQADGVAVRSYGETYGITVEGKEAAIALRQKLVRRGISCSFPVPTWERSTYEFRAKCPSGMSHAVLFELVEEWRKTERSES